MMTVSSALYVVATPIGNLGDMVPRAIETLQSVDVIAAEDTRHSARLLQHFGIETPMQPYHDHSSPEKIDALVRRLQGGESVALISDAGTPLVSDPGYRLVARAREAGVTVIPVPGPCALTAALCASGLPSDRFIFEGFLPAKTVARRKACEQLVAEERTLIFYEAPHRLLASLEDLVAVFGSARRAVLARELTKAFETIKGAPLGELAAWVAADSNQQRGEIVLIVAGAPAQLQQDIPEQTRQVLAVLSRELPLKQACALTAEICDDKKNRLYKYALASQEGARGE